jgi:hypothetical protein
MSHLLAGLLVSMAAASGPVNGPAPVHVTAGGETTRASQAGLCRTEMIKDGRRPAKCRANYMPRVSCRIPAKPGRIDVDTGAPATRLLVTLVSVNGEKEKLRYSNWRLTQSSPAGKEDWTLTLPPSARKATGLMIAARSEIGDLDYWAGLDTESCRSAQKR